MKGSGVGSGASTSSALRDGVVEIKRAAGWQLRYGNRIVRVHWNRGTPRRPSAADHSVRESSPRAIAASMVVECRCRMSWAARAVVRKFLGRRGPSAFRCGSFGASVVGEIDAGTKSSFLVCPASPRYFNFLDHRLVNH